MINAKDAPRSPPEQEYEGDKTASSVSILYAWVFKDVMSYPLPSNFQRVFRL